MRHRARSRRHPAHSDCAGDDPLSPCSGAQRGDCGDQPVRQLLVHRRVILMGIRSALFASVFNSVWLANLGKFGRRALAATAATVAPMAVRTAQALTTTLVAESPPAFAVTASPPGRNVVIDRTATAQAWVGAGAAMTESAAYVLNNDLTASQQAAFFADVFGDKGVSMLRVPMGDPDYCGTRYASGAFSAYDNSTTDDNLASFSTAQDNANIFPMLKAAYAVNSNIKFICSPWSPPPYMKTVAALVSATAYMNASAANLTEYAQYFVKYAQAFYAQIGKYPDYFTIQNEANFSPSSYPGCNWNGTDFLNFAQNYLGPALAAAGINIWSTNNPTGTTQILCGDMSWGDEAGHSLVTAAISGSYIAGAAYHAYDGNGSVQLSTLGSYYPAKQAHMTESSQAATGTAAARMATSLGYATLLSLQNGGSSITFWNLALATGGLPGPSDNLEPAVTVGSGGALTYNSEYYVIAHLAKYVKRGAVRIASTTFGTTGNTGTDLQTVAFLNPDGTVVSLLWNSGTTSLTASVIDQAAGNASTQITLAAGDIVTTVFKNPAALSVPLAPVVVLNGGSGTLTFNLAGNPPANGGSPITGYDLYVGTASGNETLVATNVALGGTLTGYANGTTYYGYAKARNAQGVSAAGPEVSAATSSTGVGAIPAKSLYVPSGKMYFTQAQSPGAAAVDVPNGYIDIQVRCNLSTYTYAATSALASNYYDPGASATNSSWLFGVAVNKLTFYGYDGSGTFKYSASSVALPTMATNTPVRLRCVANCSATAYNGFAAGTVTFFTSQDDGNTWVQLGTTVTGWTTGLAKVTTSGYLRIGTAATASGNNYAFEGSIYGVEATTET
ncbi:MAG: glycoside hydrolase family 30 protein, partial [Caulobacteraceae bacterium]